MFLIEKLPLKEVAHLFTSLRRLGHIFCLTWIAALAMSGSSIAVTLNALRMRGAR